MLALRPEPETPHIPSMTGPEGFKPIRPIRVHLARDEELGIADDNENPEADPEDAEKNTGLKMPPPAYGLWRSSVRVDPNLLHWQRIEDVEAQNRNSALNLHKRNSVHPSPLIGSRPVSVAPLASGSGGPAERIRNEEAGPRPPSYVSDDGVEYVVSAAPRSVAPSVVGGGGSGMSDVHPAWRPGFAVSEVGGWAANNAARR